MTPGETPTVAIIGAGMSGICMAVKLQGAGIDTFTIFEKADEVGGTWRDNTRPCANGRCSQVAITGRSRARGSNSSLTPSTTWRARAS
jgi:cation diffusion facilitator CzcD-associated flavoprotein CzcO